MKINLIIPSFYPAVIYGGPIFSTLYTCRELAKFDDMDIYVSTTNTNRDSKLDVETNKWLKLENFHVKYYNEILTGKFSFSLYKNIYKDIKNADIVHIQAIFNTPIPISLYYAKLFKKTTLLSPRGSFNEWAINNGNKFKKLWIKFLIKPFANYVIWHATAELEKKEILSLFPDAKVVVIPNGFSLSEFRNVNKLDKKRYMKIYAKKDIKNDIDKIVIGMGRLQRKKGFDILIRSFVKVLDKYPNSYLLIAGPDEGEKDKLLKLVDELNLKERVFFVGNIQKQEKIDFLGNADLFVLPSYTENFGNVYIESLGAGTPIIASLNTPWQDVEKYNCGKWVENSVEKTSEAMLEILSEDREIMRKNSIEFAKQYDWANIGAKFRELFLELGKENEK